MEIIYAAFASLMTIEGLGKLLRIDPQLMYQNLILCGSTEKENHE
jgi:hypothetical protein